LLKRDNLQSAACFLVLGLFTAALIDPASAQVNVSDGDTLTLNGERIRLFGIDAPEKGQSCRRGGAVWACGAEATAALVRLAEAGPVECQPQDRDRYGRTVAICRAAGVDLGGELVRLGLAVAYVTYSDRYLQEEIEARKHRRGIWASEFMLPDSFRAAGKRN
jgi:endonuclease YncB( thermonuclease family)